MEHNNSEVTRICFENEFIEKFYHIERATYREKLLFLQEPEYGGIAHG